MNAPLQPLPLQRTPEGLAYERYIRSARDMLKGMTSKDQKRAAEANADFIRGLTNPRLTPDERDGMLQKAITPAAVHVDTLLAGISVMYKNDAYIGERLMPVVPVNKRSDKYATYNKRDRFNAPDDLISTRGKSNEVTEGRSTDSYAVLDYGLSNFLDLETVQNQDAPLNEMVDLVESIAEMLALKREKRILTIVSTSGNYGGNTGAITSTNWNDSTGGTILSDILAADAALYSGSTPTRKLAFTSLTVWNTCIAVNPIIKGLFNYVREGIATTQQVAGYFGFDDILVSRAREETANEGQTASYARMLTTDIFGILQVAERPSLRSLHFGSTFRMVGDPFTTQWPDAAVGKRGGIYARIAVSETHKVVAGDAGYLITGVAT